MKEGGTFESFVAYVYQNLLQFSDCNSVISTNLAMKGLSGIVHEFDVYYEFYHLNILFRVAIECKDWSSPVDKGRVQEFWAKIDDLNNVAGVMIAKSGYQLGAVQFAQAKGIMLLTIDDLPTLPQLVAEKLRWLLLPDENALGQPFWTIMERDRENVSGNYYNLNIENKVQIPLFFGKRIAESFLRHVTNQEKWCVRGISQAQLRVLVDLSEKISHNDFALCPFPTDRDLQIQFIFLDAKELRDNYCDQSAWN